MITTLVILTSLALQALGFWVLIKHRRNVAHHRFAMRPLGRDERSHVLIERLKERESLTPSAPHAPDDTEESLRAVTLGQRVIGTLFVIGFAVVIVLCLSDLS